jgi:hypothetical protein
MTLDKFLANLAVVILNPLIKLMLALAVIYFLWGVFLYVKGADNETARKNGTSHIVWGLVGFFIMLGVYGILDLVTSTIYGG